MVNEILIAIGSRPDLIVWKNATGVARSLDGERIIRYGLPGSPDIIGFSNMGKFIGIECKTGQAKKSKKQNNFHAIAEKFGAIYFVAKSVDEAVKKLQTFV